MELSLEELLDIGLELMSSSIVLVMLFGLGHAPQMISLLERMM